MDPWLNYHHLYYFKTVAEEGTVSKAAQKLRIGQPTLSVQLKQFEDCIGVQLFERHHKKLVLTEQGKVALDYAKSIFGLGSEMCQVLSDKVSSIRPTLSIGALDSVPKQIILQLVKAAYKISTCTIFLSEGKSDELIGDLKSHRIDIVVTNFLPTGKQAKGLLPREIAKKNVGFYGAPNFKVLRSKYPKSISGAPIILPTYDSKLRYNLDYWAKIHSIDFNVIAESQDIGMKKLMAVSGLGLIATAAHTVTRQIKSGELVEIGSLKNVYEELFLLTVSRKIVNPIAAKLVEVFHV